VVFYSKKTDVRGWASEDHQLEVVFLSGSPVCCFKSDSLQRGFSAQEKEVFPSLFFVLAHPVPPQCFSATFQTGRRKIATISGAV